MRFALIFAGVAAASVVNYGPPPAETTPAAPVVPSKPAYEHPAPSGPAYEHPSKPAYEHPAPSSSSPAAPVKPSSSAPAHPGKPSKPVKYTTSTICRTEVHTSATHTYTTTIPISTTVVPCDEEEETAKPVKPSTSSAPWGHPVKPTGAAVPTCSDYTETCTVTVTATGVAPVKPYPTQPAGETPVKPVYGHSSYAPVGTGSPVHPSKPIEYSNGAAANKVAGAMGAIGAIAAFFL